MNLSYKQVENYCNELHLIAKNMNEIMQNITGIANEIANGENWSGNASEFYSKKLKSLSKNFDEVFCEMENSILFMASCAEGYQAIDKDVIREICANLNITNPNLSTSSIFN